MISQIKSLYRDKNNEDYYYGFIRALDEGNDYYFKKKDFDNLPIEDISIGMRVSFTNHDKESGQRFATEIKIIKSDADSINDSNAIVNLVL